MRAYVLGDKPVLVNDYPEPVPTDDQALLKVLKAGICNTDLELIKGYMGFQGVLGHEFVAQVITGPETLIGRRVVGEINVADGTCSYCRQGVPSQCENRSTVGIDRYDGAFADYMVLTPDNLYVVPDSVSDDAAVFVEPLAAALQVLEAVHIQPRQKVAVLGMGKLGLLVVQVLRLTGTDVYGVVRRDKQVALLKNWGIPSISSDEIMTNSVDVVVDCTGTADGFSDAVTMVKPRGTLVLKSTYAGLPQADLTRVVVDEIRVIGSRCGPFGAALRLLEHGLIDTGSLIEGTFNLDEVALAFQQAEQPGALKMLLEM